MEHRHWAASQTWVLTAISLMVPAPCQEATRGALISAGALLGVMRFLQDPSPLLSGRPAICLGGQPMRPGGAFAEFHQNLWQLRTLLSLGEAQKNGNAFPGP